MLKSLSKRTEFAIRRFSTLQAKPVTKAYDLVVIGSGPAAIECAVDAKKRGKKVAMVDKDTTIGGVCVHTGTIPSKTFREAVLHFTGYRHQGFYGKSYSIAKKPVTVQDILQRVGTVVKSEVDCIRAKLRASNVDIYPGHARFTGSHEVEVKNDSASDPLRLEAEKFLIACGTRPARNPMVPCDGELIVDSDQILSGSLNHVPKNMIVIGAGVIGIEYASMLNVLPGINVTVIDGRPEILGFADKEIVDTLCYEMQNLGARFLLGEKLKSVEHFKDGLKVQLESGKTLYGDGMLYAVGRQANTDEMGIENVNLERNSRGLITVNKKYQTTVPHIYAAGDCIGAPSLASTSMEQGRLASTYMWDDSVAGDQIDHASQLDSGNFPYGIYTIPEISMVGKTEAQLSKEGRNFGVGTSRYSELAKGQMTGGQPGVLKIIFDQDTLEILGVHAIGDGATEIIHIGQVAMAMGCKLTYFRDAVFNYPTMAEAYRVAALKGLGKQPSEYN